MVFKNKELGLNVMPHQQAHRLAQGSEPSAKRQHEPYSDILSLDRDLEFKLFVIFKGEMEDILVSKHKSSLFLNVWIKVVSDTAMSENSQQLTILQHAELDTETMVTTQNCLKPLTNKLTLEESEPVL